MASSPRETPSTGAILDVRVAGDCHLRHQAASLDVLRSAARSPRCVCPLCDDAEPSWSQHASELLPARNLHDFWCVRCRMRWLDGPAAALDVPSV